MKPGSKERQVAQLRERHFSDEDIAAATADPSLVEKAVRAFLKHRAQARDRMKRLRQKGKQI